MCALSCLKTQRGGIKGPTALVEKQVQTIITSPPYLKRILQFRGSRRLLLHISVDILSELIILNLDSSLSKSVFHLFIV